MIETSACSFFQRPKPAQLPIVQQTVVIRSFCCQAPPIHILHRGSIPNLAHKLRKLVLGDQAVGEEAVLQLLHQRRWRAEAQLSAEGVRLWQQESSVVSHEPQDKATCKPTYLAYVGTMHMVSHTLDTILKRATQFLSASRPRKESFRISIHR